MVFIVWLIDTIYRFLYIDPSLERTEKKLAYDWATQFFEFLIICYICVIFSIEYLPYEWKNRIKIAMPLNTCAHHDFATKTINTYLLSLLFIFTSQQPRPFFDKRKYSWSAVNCIRFSVSKSQFSIRLPIFVWTCVLTIFFNLWAFIGRRHSRSGLPDNVKMLHGDVSAIVSRRLSACWTAL